MLKILTANLKWKRSIYSKELKAGSERYWCTHVHSSTIAKGESKPTLCHEASGSIVCVYKQMFVTLKGRGNAGTRHTMAEAGGCGADFSHHPRPSQPSAPAFKDLYTQDYQWLPSSLQSSLLFQPTKCVNCGNTADGYFMRFMSDWRGENKIKTYSRGNKYEKRFWVSYITRGSIY